MEVDMTTNAGKIANRLFYSADMRKTRAELFARLGVDLRRQPEEKATPKETPKKRGKVCPDTVNANISGRSSGTHLRKFLYWFRSTLQAARTLQIAS